MCPDYEIKRWDESNFDVWQHPFVASAYDAGAWAFVSDWVRLKVLYDNGGVYLDTDVKLLKPLDELLENQCYIGVQQSGRLCTTGLGFGATKASPVVQEMLAKYDGLVFEWGKSEKFACPHLNDEVAREHGYSGDGLGDVEHFNGLTVYPSRYLDPIAPGESQNLMCGETVSVSLYANSWGSAADRFRRQLINLIGLERVELIKQKLQGVRRA